MPDLNLLDLSFNNLKSIGHSSLSGLRLEYIFLSDNPGLVLPSNGFNEMTAQVIDLKNCGLTSVSPNSFSSMMGTLRKIFLNGNSIRRFPPGMLAIFAGLEKLRLQDNPLVCDCESRWLKEFYDQNADKVRDAQQGNTEEPRCGAPLTVAGEFFNRLSAMDFLCEKPTLDAKISFTDNRGVMTCVSQGHPTPEISWQRPNGVRQVFSAAQDSDTTIAELEVSSTGTSVEGEYVCTAKNEAGNLTFSVDLSWPFRPTSSPCQPVPPATQEAEGLAGGTVTESTAETEKDLFKVKYFTLVDLISSILGTFVGTLIVCIIILHFCVYRRKRGPASQYSTPPMSDYSTSSVKNGIYPSQLPPQQQHCVPVHNTNPHIQARPLPKPHGSQLHNYDENHYMSTPLDNTEDLFSFAGQHNHALVHTQMPGTSVLPPCEACMTMNARQQTSS